MSRGYIFFNENDVNIPVIEKIFLKLDSIYKELGDNFYKEYFRKKHLREYLNNDVEENELRRFISHFENIFELGKDEAIDYFSSQLFDFNQSNKSLEIGVEIFYIDEWAEVLTKAFPKISFFIADYADREERIGISFRIFLDGKCTDSEDFSFGDLLKEYDLMGIESDSDEENSDETCQSMYDEFLDCLNQLLGAKAKVWKLSNNKSIDLDNAKKELQDARQLYKKTYNKYLSEAD